MAKLESVKLGRYNITKHSPVRVSGKQGTWRVVSIEEKNGKVNVEVVHSLNLRSRIFPLENLSYVRPSSRKGRLAQASRGAKV